MFFKKNNNSINYFNEYEILLDTNSELITDAYNQSYQINGFCENRHDQSIFSLMSKTLGSEIIPNETEFRNKLGEIEDIKRWKENVSRALWIIFGILATLIVRMLMMHSDQI